MVGSHKASGVLLVLLVVMATTIANGTPVVDTAKNAATAVEDTAKNAATAVGGAAASVGAKVTGAKPGGASLDVKASGAKGDGKTDDSAVCTKCLLYILYYTSILYCLRKNFTLIHACIYRHLRLHGKKLVQQGAQLQCQKVSIW